LNTLVEIYTSLLSRCIIQGKGEMAVYISRSNDERFELACKVLGLSFIDKDPEERKKVSLTIKEIAAHAGVSRNQTYEWKNILSREGPKVFAACTPGRKAKLVCELGADEQVLISESLSRLAVKVKRGQIRAGGWTAELRSEILRERNRLKQVYGLTYECFAKRMGLSSAILRLWSSKLKTEGEAGLENKSRAPKYSPEKLTPDVIAAIEDYGCRWRRGYHGRRIRIGAFADSFRRDKSRLLAKYGKGNLSNKTIRRYLKETGLYGGEVKTRRKAKRGGFRYYCPGAQLLIDTTFWTFFGVKMAIVGLMDAFSRDILHQEGFIGENAAAIVKTLKKGLKKAGAIGLSIWSVLNDHGRPYKSKKVWAYLRDKGIKRIYSAPYWPQGKAAIERYFRTLKEGLEENWQLLCYLVKGLVITLREKFLLCCLNLILIGFNGKYSITPNPGIDGKSPQERLEQKPNTAYQTAVRCVLEEDASNSELKSELIAKIYREFKLEVSLIRAKEYLGRCSKESIIEAAEALRRKLVQEDLAALNRWQYWSKTAKIIEVKKREALITAARQVLAEAKKTDREREERRRIEDQRQWYESHPEEALSEAIEWQLVCWGNKFAAIHYEPMIRESLKGILIKHSQLTAGLKVKEICQAIEKKEKVETESVLKSGWKMPEQEKLVEAKQQIIKLIQDTYSEYKDEIPSFRGIKQLWGR
jgi:transposase